MLKFEVLAEDGPARRGLLETQHGRLETPGLFAVATQGTLKGLDPESARRAGIQALIANAFHLHLRPGEELVERAGGLHRLIGWEGVLATDSGGFQIFSLRHGHVADEIKGRRQLPRSDDDDPLEAVRVDEEGADFRSHLDGSRHRFSPETNMALQKALGADICFALDECTPLHVPPQYTADVAERNLRWARRCLDEFERLGMGGQQSLFGIVHGGVYPDLRQRSARAIAELDVDGVGIGDCLGATKSDWYGIVETVTALLPPGRPRHLLGVGEPDDLIEGALRGVDSFDCAMPTRIARHGHALHRGRPRFRVDLTHAAMKDDDGPLEEGCDCHTCGRFSRAYLWHLFHAHEMLAIALTAEHNLRFSARLLELVRTAISAGRLEELRKEVLTANTC